MNAWDVCLTHDPVYGGIHRSVCNFAHALNARILSFDDGRAERSRSSEEQPVVRVTCRPRPFNRGCHVVTPVMAAEAEAHIAGADLLVVHSIFRGHAPWAARWARTHGRPFFSVLEGCLDPWGLQRHSIAKRLWLARYGRDYFANAAAIVCATNREQAKARPVIGAARSVVIRWPVPLPTLDGRGPARTRFRAVHGIPEWSRVLLFAGRLHPMKRPLETVDAFVTAGCDAHLVVVGMEEGVTVGQLKARVPSACRRRVHVTGPLSGQPLADAFLAADGFISLSHRENFGYAFAEAMGYGLPVIVSAGHDLAYEVGGPSGEFPCGWLLAGDAASAAPAALREWAAAPAPRLAALGAAGRSWVGEELAFERFRKRLHALC